MIPFRRCRADIVDSSGLRFFYTSNLRQHDASVMEVGHIVNGLVQIIPPNAQSFQQTGECISQCLDQVCVASHIIKSILCSQIALRHFCWHMANVCVESWVDFEPWAWEGGQKGLDTTLDFEIW